MFRKKRTSQASKYGNTRDGFPYCESANPGGLPMSPDKKIKEFFFILATSISLYLYLASSLATSNLLTSIQGQKRDPVSQAGSR